MLEETDANKERDSNEGIRMLKYKALKTGLRIKFSKNSQTKYFSQSPESVHSIILLTALLSET